MKKKYKQYLPWFGALIGFIIFEGLENTIAGPSSSFFNNLVVNFTSGSFELFSLAYILGGFIVGWIVNKLFK